MISIGIIGYGYWGPNLVRNFAEVPEAAVGGVADLDSAKLALVARRFPGVKVTTDYTELLRDPSIDAIAIATPVHTHYELALAALRAGKHVWVEKPMTEHSYQAQQLVDEAERRGLVLLVDHTFVYTGAVQKMAEVIHAGELGQLYYYDSIRVNLGLFQRDVSVISDLAVHDFSILDYLVGEQPSAVSASGTNHFPGTPENLAYVTLFYDSGFIAHANVSWLAPVKVRQVLIGGSKKMIAYDDLEPSEKIKVYDKGVSMTDDPQKIQEMRVGYRTGDMWAPKIGVAEALGVEGAHFVDCIVNKKVPRTDGRLGLRVVELIEAACRSMRSKGSTVYTKSEKEGGVIPFVDLKAQYLSIKTEVDAAIQGVLETCQFTLGPEVAAFEREFAAYCQAPHGIGVNTGTSALHLALLAAGVGPGDEVITVPFTFVATVSAIDYTGATPVFVDIDPLRFTMDPQAVEAAITPRTKAILPVHLYGQPADMDPIMEVARRHGLVVIEDACQAHGAEYKGRRAGSIGDLGCFSFYPGKNLGAYGEGGMVVTASPEHARTIRMLRDWGAEKKYEHVLKGFNFRLEGMQGAVLRVKLRHLERWTEARRTAAARYDTLFAGSGVATPWTAADSRHVYHLYVVRSGNRRAWQDVLAAQGIQTGIHYPTPVHLLPAFAGLGYRAGQFPHAERAANEVLSLPMFPELTAGQVDEVARAVIDLAAPPALAADLARVG